MCEDLTIPKNSKDAFAKSVDVIQPKQLADTLGCSLTHVYRMKASKKTNGEVRQDPISQTLKIIRNHIELGAFGLAYSIAELCCHAIGAEVSFRNHRPDKATYQEEMLDTAKATSGLMNACQRYIDGKISRLQMWWFKKKAHQEIDQLVAKAIETKHSGSGPSKKAA